MLWNVSSKGIGMLSLWNDVDDLFLRLPVHPVNRTDDAGTDCRSSDSLVTTKELTLFPAKGNHDADGRYSMPWVARGQGVEVLVLVFRSQRSPEGSRSVEVRANIGGYFVDLKTQKKSGFCLLPSQSTMILSKVSACVVISINFTVKNCSVI
jgi:hypothetical protein